MFNGKVELTEIILFIYASDLDSEDTILSFIFLSALCLLLEIEQFIFTLH
jgi:hypothetical protein